MHSTKVFLGFGIFALAVIHASAQATTTATCIEDASIDATTKQNIDSVAMGFAQTFFAPKPSAPSDLFTDDVTTNTTRQQLYELFATEIIHFEPTNILLQHTYFLKLKGDSPGRLTCTADVSKSADSVSLTAKNVPEQAHVLISAETINNKMALTVWLIPEKGKWKVQSFWMNLSSMADKDTVQLWELARAQRHAGHGFNAALLYAAALQTAYRGSDYQLGITEAISDDMSQFKAPVEVQCQPPFIWKDGESIYKIMQVGPIAIGGKLYVAIGHEVAPWQNDEQVDGWNRVLITYFKRQFPEYSDVFSGIVIRAYERRSNRGYGTVEDSPHLK